MANFTQDKRFVRYKKSLEEKLAGYTSSKEKDKFTRKQKSLVESLVREEKRFKRALLKNPDGKKAYQKFIEFIIDEQKNILAARPYFRERQRKFSSQISPALRERSVEKLSKFNINYPFINFIVKCHPWPKNGYIVKIANKIKGIREEIILQNMPLAISRATLFRKKTPESHLDFMDINQISNEGLINAVDKFVLPYTTVFRSVIIGRISGDLIENYSETLIHFWPDDKRKIYRANKAGKDPDKTIEQVVESVNSGPELNSLTNESEIRHLVMAASPVSMYLPAEDGSEIEKVPSKDTNAFEASENFRPDVLVEDLEEKSNLNKAYSELTIFEKKILRMKGLGL